MKRRTWLLPVLLAAALPACLGAQGTTPSARTEEAQRMVRGVVFEDTNGNGRRDAGERVFGGAEVSAGGGVVTADAQGRYTIALDAHADFVWVIADLNEYEPPFWRRVPAEGTAATAGLDIGLAPRKTKPFRANPRIVHLVDIGGGPVGADKTDPEFQYMLREIARLQPKVDILVIAGDGKGAARRREILKQESPAAEVLHVFASEAPGSELHSDYESFNRVFGPCAYVIELPGMELAVTSPKLVEGFLPRSLEVGAKSPRLVDGPLPPDASGLETRPDTIRPPSPPLELHHPGLPRMGFRENAFETDPRAPAGVRTTGSFRKGGLVSPVGFRVVDLLPGGRVRTDFVVAGLTRYLHPIHPNSEATVAPGPLQVSLALGDTASAPDVAVKLEMAQVKSLGERLELKELVLPEYETVVRGSLTRTIEFKKPLSVAEGYYVMRFTASGPGGAVWSKNVSLVVPKEPPPQSSPGVPWVGPGGGDLHAGATRDTVIPPFYLSRVVNVGGRVLRGPLVVLPRLVLVRREGRDALSPGGALPGAETTPTLRVLDEPFCWHEADSAIAAGTAPAATAGQGLFALRGDHVVLEAAGEPSREFRFDFTGPPPHPATTHLAVGGEFLCLVDARGAAWGFVRARGAEVKEGKYDRKAAEGSLKWRVDISPGCRQAVVSELELFTGNECLEIVTGKTRWTLEKHVLRDRSVALDGRQVVITGVTAQDGPARQMVLVADRETGKIIWERVLAEVGPRDEVETAPPAVVKGAVIVGSADGVLRSLLLAKGDESWSFKTVGPVLPLSARPDRPAGRISSQAVVSDRFVFFAGADGRLYALDRRKGVLEWTYAIGVPVVASPALSGNTLYLADCDGNLYSFVSLVVKKSRGAGRE